MKFVRNFCIGTNPSKRRFQPFCRMGMGMFFFVKILPTKFFEGSISTDQASPGKESIVYNTEVIFDSSAMVVGPEG